MHLGYIFQKPVEKWTSTDLSQLSLNFADRLKSYALNSNQKKELNKESYFLDNKNIYITNDKHVQALLDIIDVYDGKNSALHAWILKRKKEIGVGQSVSEFDSVKYENISICVEKALDELDKLGKNDSDNKDTIKLIADQICKHILVKFECNDETSIINKITEIVNVLHSNDKKESTILIAHGINNILEVK